MYVFIVNPIAGNGKSKKIFSKIRKTELFKEINETVYYTKYDGHAEEIAANLINLNQRKVEAIIVISGDGTLHEVINGLSNDTNIPVAFIPGGSGNDFARGVQLGRNPIRIFHEIIKNREASPYWLGTYKIDEKRQHFVNSIGFGFDAAVAKRANESSMKKFLNKLHLGQLSYLSALISVLFRFQFFNVELEIDGKKRRYNRCFMVLVGNHPYLGGGLKILPEAKVQPDKFSILMIHSVSKLKVLGVFLTVLWGGHVNFSEVTVVEAEKLKIISNKQLDYQVDGETDKIAPLQSCTIVKKTHPIHILGTEREESEIKKIS